MKRRGLALVWISLLTVVAGCGQRLLVPGSSSLPLQLQLSPERIAPGHALRITVQCSGAPAAVRACGWNQDVALTALPGQPGQHLGYLAVPLETSAGFTGITVTAAAAGCSPTAVSQSVEVTAREPFNTVRLRLQDFQSGRYAVESQIMAAARQEPRPCPGPPWNHFTWPLAGPGRMTESFGARRIYNGGAGEWYHGGWDIAAPAGTSIFAAADGLVILAQPFAAHGNTVLIDHGYGVVTTYLHQRKLYVHIGDRVRQGQAIGEVGSTGGSTGNHLHFQVNVNGLIVIPSDFLKETQWLAAGAGPAPKAQAGGISISR